MPAARSRKYKFYDICSQVQPEANRAKAHWNLKNHEAVVGDNQNVVVQYLKDRYMSELFITNCSLKSNLNGLNAKDYPTGAVQPAVLIFVGDKPAFAWASIPSAANIHGSLGRPDPVQIWNVVEHCLQCRYQGVELQCLNGDGLDIVGGLETSCRAYCNIL